MGDTPQNTGADEGSSGLLSQSDLDELLNAAQSGALKEADAPSSGATASDAPAATSTAADFSPATSTAVMEPPTGGVGAESVELPDFGGDTGATVDPARVSMLSDVNLNVRIELGRTRMLVEDVLKLGDGSVVVLDKLAGDPVDVYVNDRLVARGEVLVLNDCFCVRISDVFSHDPHRIVK